MSSIRIVIADDHMLFRNGIIKMLDGEKDIFIVGEAQDGKELIKRYFELRPDIMLVDIAMPDMTGTEALTKIIEKEPEAKALFLSMHEGEEYIYYTMKAGGKGLISKNIATGELVYAIKTVNEGNLYFGNIWKGQKLEELIKKYEAASSEKEEDITALLLTEKELEILKLIGEGFTSNEISEKLEVGKRTIDSHRVKIMQKLDLKSFPELMSYAVKYITPVKNSEST